MTSDDSWIKCQKCGVKFVRRKNKGREPKFCPACAADRLRESRKAFKDELKANGWCVDCGNKALPGRVRCAACKERQNQYMKEWAKGRRRKKKHVD